MSEPAYGRLQSTAAWRLRHPKRTLRALLPSFMPQRLRASAGRLAGNSASAADAVGAWWSEMQAFDVPPLEVPERPVASIHIVTHNNLEVTRLCIESIVRLTRDVRYEIIVVDNGSTDGTVAWLEERGRGGVPLRVISRPENAGFATASNQAVAASSGKIVCLLNNDTVVTPGWLSHLASALDVWDGLVGPVTNSCGNEARVDASYGALKSMLSFADENLRAKQGSAFAIPMLGFYCIAMKRTTWNRIGPLDERFGIGMFEDDDYARRARAANLPVVCLEDVFVHHWGRVTFRSLGDAEYARLWEENKRAFRQKWE